MDLEHLNKWAKIKGIKVLGTGDFTHPVWLENLKEKLEPAESGLFKLKKPSLYSLAKGESTNEETRFILTSEISCIYTKGGKVRKIHIIVFSPSFEVCEKINVQLGWIGNLKADGRPILGLDAKELAKIVLNISPDCFIVPAHCWTPWFSIFGSKSGFDSIEECFEEYSKYIYAGETGLSSDPAMNWRLSSLDKIALISNSDAHSPKKIGREANVFDTEVDYFKIIEAIKTKNPSKFLYTIEFFPEEGKYHYDGHRACGIVMSPAEANAVKKICPVCKKELTIGVAHRVEELADRAEGEKVPNLKPFNRIIPLSELISAAIGSPVASKKTFQAYNELIAKFGNEFAILLDATEEELAKATDEKIVEFIMRNRKQEIKWRPGYDGEYGHPIFDEKAEAEKKALPKPVFEPVANKIQRSLGDF